MENELSLTQFLARLGCPLRIGYYWSAKSEDNSRVIFTIWSDQLNGDLYELWPSVDPLPDWTRLPGAHEWRRHIDVARGESVEILGVLCHAVDPAARRRERAYYDERSLLVLALEEKDGETFARVVGEVGVDIARDARVRGHVTPQRSALMTSSMLSPRALNFLSGVMHMELSFGETRWWAITCCEEQKDNASIVARMDF
ncbi:MAG TPA: hypothetical protein PLU47_03140 [Azonexus sp.]|nr:hypothetical protein [Azonexus sp.]